MIIGIPKESLPGENRVAILPADIIQLSSDELVFKIESGAGKGSFIADEDYKTAGAEIVSEIYSDSDLIIRINPPSEDELPIIKERTSIISLMSPFTNHKLVKNLAKNKVSSFCLELIPRSTYAQSMDVLSSQATVSGYGDSVVVSVVRVNPSVANRLPILPSVGFASPPSSLATYD